MPTKNLEPAQIIWTQWDAVMKSLIMHVNSRGRTDDIDFPLTPQQRAKLLDMCTDQLLWQEFKIVLEDKTLIAWKIPDAIGIRIETKGRSFSAIYHYYHMWDLSVIFSGEPDVKVKGMGQVEHD